MWSKRDNHGLYNVSLDGTMIPSQSGFASHEPIFQTPLFSSTDLENGEHTVVIINAENNPPEIFLDIDFVSSFLSHLQSILSLSPWLTFFSDHMGLWDWFDVWRVGADCWYTDWWYSSCIQLPTGWSMVHQSFRPWQLQWRHWAVSSSSYCVAEPGSTTR